jgi:hypothetical protein
VNYPVGRDAEKVWCLVAGKPKGVDENSSDSSDDGDSGGGDSGSYDDDDRDGTVRDVPWKRYHAVQMCYSMFQEVMPAACCLDVHWVPDLRFHLN